MYLTFHKHPASFVLFLCYVCFYIRLKALPSLCCIFDFMPNQNKLFLSCLLSAGWSHISKSGTILIVLKNLYEERLPISTACCMYIQIDFRSFGETGLIVFIISSSRISVGAKGVLKGGTDHT